MFCRTGDTGTSADRRHQLSYCPLLQVRLAPGRPAAAAAAADYDDDGGAVAGAAGAVVAGTALRQASG